MCSNFIYQTDLQIALPAEEALSIWVLRTPSLDKIIPLISYAIFFFCLKRLNIQMFVTRSEFSTKLGMYQTKLYSNIGY